MNLIAAPKTMSSRELADLINDERYGVEPSIRLNKLNEKIVDELEGEHYTKSVVQNPNNTKSILYHLTLDQCMLIGMRESKKVRRSVLARLKVMEAKAKQPAIPQTLSEALQLAADQAKQLEEAKPKIEFYEQVTGSEDTVDVGQAAKVLNMGIGRTKLFQLLRDEKVLQGNNQPYQSFIDRGYFRVVESKFNKPNGDTHINMKTVVYQKGLDYIRKLITKSRA